MKLRYTAPETTVVVLPDACMAGPSGSITTPSIKDDERPGGPGGDITPPDIIDDQQTIPTGWITPPTINVWED